MLIKLSKYFLGVFNVLFISFFHVARTPFQRRFKATPSGHTHSEEICISKNKEKLGYRNLDLIIAARLQIYTRSF